MNALTTLKLTSASSSASRISRSAASTVSSVSRDFAAQRLEDVLEAGAERFEHGDRSRRDPARAEPLSKRPYGPDRLERKR